MLGVNYETIYAKLQEDIIFLFVTATETETSVLLDSLKPLAEYNEVVKCYTGNETYYIGLFGRYNIVHVQCGSMGAMGRDSSINTVSEAISKWDPHAIIMVGIAFGVDKLKQQIGDVLVSQSIINYENVRVSKIESHYRSNRPECGKMLLNRFQNMREWKFKLDNGDLARKHIGLLLSGEKLIDNDAYKDSLISNLPNAIGGEMEGYGVYSASSNASINEWIIVKGICDWADGNKSVNKVQNQLLAAKSAISLCMAVLSEDSFSDLKKKKRTEKDISAILSLGNIQPVQADYMINARSYYQTLCPRAIPNRSCRSEFVDNVCKLLQEYDWVHIKGSAWCGKSQLLVLAANRFTEYQWISLKDKDPKDAYFILIDLMRNRTGQFNLDVNHLVDQFLSIFSREAVLLIDDLPDLKRDDSLLEFMILFSKHTKHQNIGLITTNNQSMPKIENSAVINIEIPPISEYEIKEILNNLNAPISIINTKLATWLSVTNGRMPAVIMALVNYLKNNEWDINDDVFNALMQSNDGEVLFELQQIIRQTVPIEDTRELLYRIAIIWHEIAEDLVIEIANIDPSINHPLEHLSHLLNLWVLREGNDQYVVSSGIRSLAERNISKGIKKQISSTIANSIIKKRLLNQIDVDRVILHLVTAEKYDEAGHVLINALIEIENSEYSGTPTGFVQYWNHTVLPNKMNDELKCKIRLAQIKALLKFGLDTDFVVQDFINCSESSHELNRYLIVGAIITGLNDKHIAINLFNRALLKGAKLSIEEEKDLPMGVKSAALFLTCANIRDFSVLSKWLQNLILINRTEIEDFCDNEVFHATLFIAVERVVQDAINSKDDRLINNTMSLFADMQQYGLKMMWPFIISIASREYLHLVKHKFGLQEAITYHNNSIPKMLNDTMANYLLTSKLASLSYEDDYLYTEDFIRKSQEFEVKEEFLLLEKISLHLSLSSILEKKDVKEAYNEIKKAIDDVITAVEFGMAYRLKIYGEYLIFCYLHGFTADNITKYYEVAKVLLENETFDDREEIIALCCHVYLYIIEDTIYKFKPEYVGSDVYAAPRMNMFIGDRDKKWFIENHDEAKLYYVLFLISELLSYYGINDKSQEIMREAIIRRKSGIKEKESKRIGWMSVVSSFIWLQSIRCGCIEEAFEILNVAHESISVSRNIRVEVLTNQLFALTISYVNMLIENRRDNNSTILKIFYSELYKFCKQHEDIPLVKKYIELLEMFVQNQCDSRLLIRFGNYYKASYPDLQLISYILSTSQLPITQDTLKIQINALMYISRTIAPSDSFYRLEYFDYLKNTWHDLLAGEAIPPELRKAHDLMLNPPVPLQFSDLKYILISLRNGLGVNLFDENDSWLNTE